MTVSPRTGRFSAQRRATYRRIVDLFDSYVASGVVDLSVRGRGGGGRVLRGPRWRRWPQRGRRTWPGDPPVVNEQDLALGVGSVPATVFDDDERRGSSVRPHFVIRESWAAEVVEGVVEAADTDGRLRAILTVRRVAKIRARKGIRSLDPTTT